MHLAWHLATDGRGGSAVLGRDGSQPCPVRDAAAAATAAAAAAATAAAAAAAAGQGAHALLLLGGDLPGYGSGAPCDGAHLGLPPSLPPARPCAIECRLHTGLRDEGHQGVVVLGTQRTQRLHRSARGDRGEIKA